MGPYRLISKGDELPVFAFALNHEIENYTVFDVSDRLRERGWLVPAYSFPENRQDLSVLRIVVRAGMHLEMADKLLEFLGEQTAELQSLSGPLPRHARRGRTPRSRTDGMATATARLGARLIGGERADHGLQPRALVVARPCASGVAPSHRVAARPDRGQRPGDGIAAVGEHEQAPGPVTADAQLLDHGLSRDFPAAARCPRHGPRSRSRPRRSSGGP